MALGSIQLILGDITTLPADAIVNAANTSLLAGGGVCGAIHMVAGPELEKECLLWGGCPVGEARLTEAYNLQARYVIHAVGPRYWDGSKGEAKLLRACYRSVFKLVAEWKIESIGFPAIGTGIHGFPLEEATNIAMEETYAALKTTNLKVIFCCYDRSTYEVYYSILKSIDVP